MAAPELRGKVSLDGSGFTRTLGGLKGQAQQFAGSLKGLLVGAFSVAAITSAAKSIVNVVGSIKDLSEQSNLTTAEVQRLDHALRQSGLAFEDVSAALRKMGDARQKAVEEGGALLATFEKYGVVLKDLQSPQLRHIDILQKVMATAAGMNITQREQGELAELVGDKSIKLINALRELDQFEGLKIIDQKDIDKLDEASKKLEEFKRQLLILGTENLSAALDIRLQDILAGALTPGALEAIGIDATKTADVDSGALTKEQIEAANRRKRERLAAERATAGTPLYEADKKSKEQERDRSAKLRASIETKQEKLRVAQLSPAQRGAELNQTIKDILAQLQYTPKGSGTDLALRDQLADAKGELFGLTKRKGEKGGGGSAYHVNELQQIGGYVPGGAGAGLRKSETERIASQSLQTLKRIERNTQPRKSLEPFGD